MYCVYGEKERKKKKAKCIFTAVYLLHATHIYSIERRKDFTPISGTIWGFSHIPISSFFHPVSLIPVYENTTRTVEKLDAPAACVCVAFYVGLFRAIVKAKAEQSLLLPIYNNI